MYMYMYTTRQKLYKWTAKSWIQVVKVVIIWLHYQEKSENKGLK